MTDEELIGKQARRIAYLEERVELDTAARERVETLLKGTGGPLNDDSYGCSAAIRVLFQRIAEELGFG